MTAGASAAQGNNLFWNSDFEEGSVQPWSMNFSAPAAGDVAVENGELCLKIQEGGKNHFDVVLRQRGLNLQQDHEYTLAFKARATAPTKIRSQVGPVSSTTTEYWSAVVDLGTQPQTFSGSFKMNGKADPEGQFMMQLGGPLYAASGPVTVCIDDVKLTDPKFELPVARSVGPLPRVRVNQVGYLPNVAKHATYKTASKTPLEWQLVDADGAVVNKGQTKYYGEDPAAGDHVHIIDFSAANKPGKGYKLKVGQDESYPFDIGPNVYTQLKYDALAYFYHNRSGIPIQMPYAGDEKWTRPAGHPGDKQVACAPGTCNYSLDVSGGWYDAGDHGKYVVNGGISLWTLFNQYERAKYLGSTVADFGDGKLKVPEKGNGIPDILDEARWELEFMMRMQVPAGQPLAGMVHHKIHSEKWTDIPTLPHEDQVKRYLRPPSTAATLNLAATAAQGARIFKPLDKAFAAKCLKAAQTAWAAAVKNPAVYAPGSDNEGGGPYGDINVTDEFYWAAAELYLTTGHPAYADYLSKQDHHTKVMRTAGGGTASMSWDNVAALGTISLAVVPGKLDKATVDNLRKLLTDTADYYLGLIEKRGYRVPMESETRYPWGSNSFIINNMLVMGLAYDFTKQQKYVDGVADAMDYILGRNPNAQSYVTGYGQRPLQNPHHRFWAHQKNEKFPAPPPGAVSGGPNSSIEDPYAKQAGLGGCPPQKCFVDHIESWSTNEITINWNAPLAWAAAFLDERGKSK